ncbi:hypothetical protein AB205_0059800, partial [Aquarana catesbeiana]
YPYPENEQHLLFAKEGPRHVHLDGDPDQHRNFRVITMTYFWVRRRNHTLLIAAANI